jgi:nitrite reductase (NO-forming)
MRKQFRAILLVAGLVLVTACNGAAAADSAPDPGAAARPAASASGAQQVTVEVGNAMKFEPASVVVKAGQPVELTLKSEGSMPHDFSLLEGVSQPVKIEAGPGQTALGTFTIQQPGTYTFICSVPGHEAAGMKGTITAQ